MSRNNFFSRHKVAIIVSLVLVLVAAAGCGVWYYLGHSNADPVYVFPFHYIGMTEYWGDNQESYGPVTTDRLQTVYLTDTQTVVEVAVQPGDTVKKGDLLMTFDTTLSDLQLERKRLEVEKQKLQLEDAKAELKRIRNMKPMVVYEYEGDSDDSDLGGLLSSYQIYGMEYGGIANTNALNYDGSSRSKPLVLWLSSGHTLNSAVMDELFLSAETLQTRNLQNSLAASGEDLGETPPTVSVSKVYAVVRVTESNREFGSKSTWQGVVIYEDYGLQFFTPEIGDPFMDAYNQEDTGPYVEMNSGFTAAQLAQMRKDQEKKIQDLEFSVKMAETEYKIMQLEMSDGNVYADIDGEVVSVLTEEEAKATQQPFLKVSGGGGFYVEGFVSELEKDNLEIGQTVTVNDWNTGMTYEAEVVSIGDFPTQDGYFNGMGNPNASYYPFRVFLDGSADLQAGSYVSIMYSTSQGESGIYLENPFLRTEGGRSYVLVQGPDGTLEQRFVTTGKSLWGSYTEIRSGLTPEDLIAFPYGKNVKPGVKAVEGDLSNLYG